MRNTTIELPAADDSVVKRARWQAAKPKIETILRMMEDVGYCPSAIALVQIILGSAIVDPDDFTERADDLLAVLFGE